MSNFCFTTGKIADSSQQNEDSVLATENLLAVSDGAGGVGIFAKEWSQYLLNKLPQNPFKDFTDFTAWTDTIWEEFEQDITSKMGNYNNFVENKFNNEGSFATLVVAWFSKDNDNNKISYCYYGDSALFVVNKATGKIDFMTHENLAIYDSNPHLINWKNLPKEKAYHQGEYELKEEHIVLLASDALACYITMAYYAYIENEQIRECANSEGKLAIIAQNMIKIAKSLPKKEHFYKDFIELLCSSLDINMFREYMKISYNNKILIDDDYSLAIYESFYLNNLKRKDFSITTEEEIESWIESQNDFPNTNIIWRKTKNWIDEKANSLIEIELALYRVRFCINRLENYLDNKIELTNKEIEEYLDILVRENSLTLEFPLHHEIDLLRARIKDATNIETVQYLSYNKNFNEISKGRLNAEKESIFYGCCILKKDNTALEVVLSEVNAKLNNYIYILRMKQKKDKEVVVNYVGIWGYIYKAEEIVGINGFILDYLKYVLLYMQEKFHPNVFEAFYRTDKFIGDILTRKQEDYPRLYNVTSVLSSLYMESKNIDAIIYTSVPYLNQSRKKELVIAVKPNSIDKKFEHVQVTEVVIKNNNYTTTKVATINADGSLNWKNYTGT